MSVETMIAVYECPSREERVIERRCPDRNIFCRQLDQGGGEGRTDREVGDRFVPPSTAFGKILSVSHKPFLSSAPRR